MVAYHQYANRVGANDTVQHREWKAMRQTAPNIRPNRAKQIRVGHDSFNGSLYLLAEFGPESHLLPLVEINRVIQVSNRVRMELEPHYPPVRR